MLLGDTQLKKPRKNKNPKKPKIKKPQQNNQTSKNKMQVEEVRMTTQTRAVNESQRRPVESPRRLPHVSVPTEKAEALKMIK